MRGKRSLGAVGVVFVTLTAAWACDTDAKGVEDCRDIERARCQAAPSCDLGIETEQEVAECERYMRDHCLHGLDTEEGPTAAELKQCVEAIQAAQECASADDEEACVQGLRAPGSDALACQMIQSPEEMDDCQFLIRDPEPPEEDSGSNEPPEDAATD